MLVMVSWELYPETKMDAFAAFSQMSEEDDAAAVSYTHLTLPTILRV